ncbi:unnamed protein product [Brassicogethes aeneus]|uniref:Programmed cell death protein 2 C-terminal domain-containing protein n=1 Tax=Brassicogethes aeneus TaxID=1431903 RepID=A0A9P0FJP9_BRAAE|nr:unnamed protein product [Brassicogethes aeneus]
MACYSSKVLLGFEDELVTDKNKGQLNFTVNKIGGKPDVPSNVKLECPVCTLCQLPRPLIVQIYAPLENSNYHRTLYLFACINPNCWNHNESWVCLRAQTVDQLESKEASASVKISRSDWCADADDWDVEEGADDAADNNRSKPNEENGNLEEDDDDESCSLEDSIRSNFGSLTVDDRNANVGAQGGAVGRQHSPPASAEIEGDEGEVISIDSPTMPQSDIAALLQEVTPLPQELCQNVRSDIRRSFNLQFVSSYMAVWEETNCNSSSISDRHVKELLQEYQQRNEEITKASSPGHGDSPTETAYEKYEKSNPAHGDKMFYHFMSKIQTNPAQLLRYSRDMESPLLLYPVQEVPKKCQHCQGPVTFEFQLVPTLITKLKLIGDAKPCARVEFGTVLVYTCQSSCWATDGQVKIESVIVQKELY